MNWVARFDDQSKVIVNEDLKGKKVSLVYKLNQTQSTSLVSLNGKQINQDYIVLEQEEQKVIEEILLSNCSVLIYQGKLIKQEVEKIKEKIKHIKYDCLVFIQDDEEQDDIDLQKELINFKDIEIIKPDQELQLDRSQYKQIDFGQIKFDIQDLNQKTNMNKKQWEMEKEMFLMQIANFESDKQNQIEKQKAKLKSEIEWAKKDIQKNNKEQSQKYEKQIQKLEQEIEKLEEESTQNIIQLDQQKYSQQTIQSQSDEKIDDLKQQLYDIEQKQRYKEDDSTLEINNLQEEIIVLKQKQVDPQIEQSYKRNIKEKEQEIYMLKTQQENEIQLLTQNKNFIEQQLNSAQKQAQQTKDTYENIIKAMKDTSEENNNQKEANEEQIQQIQMQLEQQYGSKIQILNSQLEKTKSQNEQQLLEKDVKIKEIQDELMQNINELEALKYQYEDKLTTYRQSSEETRDKEEERFNLVLLESQKSDRDIIKQLQFSIENNKQDALQELSKERILHEQSLLELRTHYEAEKEQLEMKLKDTSRKEAFAKEIAELQKEFELDKQDLEQQVEEFEAEVNDLKDEIQKNQESNKYIIQMKQQEINNLMKFADDLRAQLKSVQGQFEKSIDQQVGRLQEEKKVLQEKLDDLMKQMKQLEKENAILQERVSQKDKQLLKKNAIIEQMSGQKESSNQENIIYIEQLKAKLQASGEELLDKKVQSTKDLALLQQQLTFKETLIQQLENDKQQYEIQAREKNNQLMMIQEQLENEKKKNMMNEEGMKGLQQCYNKDMQGKESQFTSMQRELQEYQQSKIIQGEQFTLLKNNLENEKKIIMEELEKYKRLYGIAEQEKHETQNNLDRETTLFQNKLAFLEKQKETYKNDLSDTLKKFDMTLQHLKKARMNDQNDNQKNFKEVIGRLEKKHSEQMKDQKDMHRRDKQALEDRLRQGEPEDEMGIKEVFKDKDKQISYLQMQETKLKEQLQAKQEEYDCYLSEVTKSMEDNKEMYKKKYQELDERLKSTDQQKSQQKFEYEKEKTKWKLERDNLLCNNGELQEIFNKQQQKREKLLKDNEKLRNNNKSNGMLVMQQSHQTLNSHDYMNNNNNSMSNNSLNNIYNGNPGLPMGRINNLQSTGQKSTHNIFKK